MTVRAGILEENLSTAKALIGEVLTKSEFDDINKIKEIVMQTYEMARQSAISSGHSLGIGAVQAQYSAKGAVNEAINGYSSMRFLHDFADDFNGMVHEFMSLVNRVKAEAICKTNLIVSITSSENISVSDLLSKFRMEMKCQKRLNIKPLFQKEWVSAFLRKLPLQLRGIIF